ncbi:hypothetical protein B0J13DRAFT_259663 [Dactylonectria estremocensis]|uniref:Uncharacterized protein n=1 Tax=Dactylonectria estremocensis TaxID=1079267 RepID=A0A9P9F4Y4_9HYPO|nr:hypothetical protein B0J13DRAFT_259663 [Dactylonectria estremocensis]
MGLSPRIMRVNGASSPSTVIPSFRFFSVISFSLFFLSFFTPLFSSLLCSLWGHIHPTHAATLMLNLPPNLTLFWDSAVVVPSTWSSTPCSVISHISSRPRMRPGGVVVGPKTLSVAPASPCSSTCDAADRDAISQSLTSSQKRKHDRPGTREPRAYHHPNRPSSPPPSPSLLQPPRVNTTAGVTRQPAQLASSAIAYGKSRGVRDSGAVVTSLYEVTRVPRIQGTHNRPVNPGLTSLAQSAAALHTLTSCLHHLFSLIFWTPCRKTSTRTTLQSKAPMSPGSSRPLGLQLQLQWLLLFL